MLGRYTNATYIRLQFGAGCIIQWSSPLNSNACYCKTILITHTIAGLITISYEDLVDGDSENSCEDHKVVD